MNRDFATYLQEGPHGEFREIDLELARFLEREHPGQPDQLYCTACLLSWSYRQGDVCLDLREWSGKSFIPGAEPGEEAARVPPTEEWVRLLRESPAVGTPGAFRPMILDEEGRLYLHRMYVQEQSLAGHLLRRCEAGGEAVTADLELLSDGLARLFPPADATPDWQRVGAALGVLNRLTVISGGPGTGKTATVIRLMALLLEQAEAKEREYHIVLAAPTGKAAARLKESVLETREELDCSEWVRSRLPSGAATLHRLLGARRHTTEFVHNRENPLPADAVIVDEASMVDQALMNRLLEALTPDTRLVLLGDKDQLASVEAGSVLGDICGSGPPRFSTEMADTLSRCGLEVPGKYRTQQERPLDDRIVLLERNYRFGEESGIAAFAGAVNRGDAAGALELLEAGGYPDLQRKSYPDAASYREELSQWVLSYMEAAGRGGGPGEAFRAYRNNCLLSPHRRGPLGAEELNESMEQILVLEGVVSRYATWYAGKPVIITRNDRLLGLYNGDIGICLPDGEGRPRVWFEKEGGWSSCSPARLSHWEPAWALTVHKSQGSEFERVVLMLPSPASRIMSRELIYTAVTRARTAVSLRGELSVLKESVERSVERSSGLKSLLHPA